MLFGFGALLTTVPQESSYCKSIMVIFDNLSHKFVGLDFMYNIINSCYHYILHSYTKLIKSDFECVHVVGELLAHVTTSDTDTCENAASDVKACIYDRPPTIEK